MDTPVRYTHLPTPVMPRVPPQKLLLGQKALVTGASSGIGRAIALALGEAGADVVVNYVSGEDKAQSLVEEIAAKGSSAIAVRADVSDEAQVRRCSRHEGALRHDRHPRSTTPACSRMRRSTR